MTERVHPPGMDLYDDLLMHTDKAARLVREIEDHERRLSEMKAELASREASIRQIRKDLYG